MEAVDATTLLHIPGIIHRYAKQKVCENYQAGLLISKDLKSFTGSDGILFRTDEDTLRNTDTTMDAADLFIIDYMEHKEQVGTASVRNLVESLMMNNPANSQLVKLVDGMRADITIVGNNQMALHDTQLAVVNKLEEMTAMNHALALKLHEMELKSIEAAQIFRDTLKEFRDENKILREQCREIVFMSTNQIDRADSGIGEIGEPEIMKTRTTVKSIVVPSLVNKGGVVKLTEEKKAMAQMTKEGYGSLYSQSVTTGGLTVGMEAQRFYENQKPSTSDSNYGTIDEFPALPKVETKKIDDTKWTYVNKKAKQSIELVKEFEIASEQKKTLQKINKVKKTIQIDALSFDWASIGRNQFKHKIGLEYKGIRARVEYNDITNENGILDTEAKGSVFARIVLSNVDDGIDEPFYLVYKKNNDQVLAKPGMRFDALMQPSVFKLYSSNALNSGMVLCSLWESNTGAYNSILGGIQLKKDHLGNGWGRVRVAWNELITTNFEKGVLHGLKSLVFEAGNIGNVLTRRKGIATKSYDEYTHNPGWNITTNSGSLNKKLKTLSMKDQKAVVECCKKHYQAMESGENKKYRMYGGMEKKEYSSKGGYVTPCGKVFNLFEEYKAHHCMVRLSATGFSRSTLDDSKSKELMREIDKSLYTCHCCYRTYWMEQDRAMCELFCAFSQGGKIDDDGKLIVPLVGNSHAIEYYK